MDRLFEFELHLSAADKFDGPVERRLERDPVIAYRHKSDKRQKEGKTYGPFLEPDKIDPGFLENPQHVLFSAIDLDA
jgi:hypothetical protein